MSHDPFFIRRKTQILILVIHEIFSSLLQSLYIRRCPKIKSNPFEVLKNVRYIYSQ